METSANPRGDERGGPTAGSVTPTGGGGGDVIPCIAPASGRSLGSVPVDDAEACEVAAEAARDAARDWAATPVSQRIAIIKAFRDAALDAAEELVDTVVSETGKAQLDAISEVFGLIDATSFYCSHAKKQLADDRVSSHLWKNKGVRVAYEPYGVVVNISPWNYPLELSITPIIPALLAGNAVIVKPSELTPLSALKAVEIAARAGLPPGLLQVVTGYGATGAALIDHADFVLFTGSVATGRKVASACAERLIPYTLELGGKDPMLVLEDADVERAINGAVWGAFTNSGQLCMSVERCYVAAPIYDRFVEGVVHKTRELRQGDPQADGEIDVGAMVSEQQIDIIRRQLDDAVSRGARVLTGGQRVDRNGGRYFEPTVVVDVDHDMELMTEEFFGPVLPIMRVHDEAEAIQRANDSRYGLNASVWSKDRGRAERVARSVQSGSVCVNDVVMSYAIVEAPFGGVKESGVGRTRSADAIRKFCKSKTIMADRVGLNREPYWFPYSDRVADGFVSGLRVLYGRGIKQRISAIRSLFG